jgi:hypothetical protein
MILGNNILSQTCVRNTDKQKDVKMAEEKKTDLVEKKEINAYESFEAFMRVVNRHRPYEPSDFVKEYFIPDHIR